MADVTGEYYTGSGDIGYGSEILVGQGDASPETFVALSDVIEINLGGFTAEVLDKTHLRSPNRAHEKFSGMRDYDNITVRCNWSSHGSHKNAGGDGFTDGGMRKIHKTQEERNFMVLMGPDSPQEEITFPGRVTGIAGPTLATTGKMEVTYTITPSQDYIGDLP